MKLPTLVSGKHKIRDSKILSLYATDAWTYDQIGQRFGISGTRVGTIIYRNRELLKIDRAHEKVKRINILKRVMAKKSEDCPQKDKLDVMDKLRQECEGDGSDNVGRADTRVIIIRETTAPAINRMSSINGEITHGDPDQSGTLSRSISIVRG